MSEREPVSALLALRLTIELFDSGAKTPLPQVELDETTPTPRLDLSHPAFDSNCGACGSDSDVIVVPDMGDPAT
jgi:hypothetical protein